MTFPYEVTVQSMRDIKTQAPDTICELTQTPVAINLLVNREAPPFNDPEIRRAMQLAIDRKTLSTFWPRARETSAGRCSRRAGGLWGLPPEILQTLPDYGPDVQANRAEARKLMEKHGYGPDKRLPVKVATRNIAQYRDPAVILIDQMKEIYIDGELDTVETANWFPKIARKDFMVGANLSGSGVDDPDAYFYEHYACGSERNYTNYCNPGLEKMYEQQSVEPDQEKRKKLVWEIDRQAPGRRGPPDHLSIPARHLPLPARAWGHGDGQQHLQRLAFRGRVARPLILPVRVPKEAPNRMRKQTALCRRAQVLDINIHHRHFWDDPSLIRFRSPRGSPHRLSHRKEGQKPRVSSKV